MPLFLLLGLFLIGLVFAVYARRRARHDRLSPDFRALFYPPVFADEEKTRVAALLTRVLRGVLIVTLIVTPLVILLQPTHGRPNVALLGSATGLITLGLLTLTRRGYVRLASALLPSLLLVIVTLALLTFGGLRSPTVSGYLAIIVIAGLLLGERGAVVFSVLCASALLGVYLAEASGAWRIPYGPLTGFDAWLLYGEIFALTTLVLGLAARSIREGLENIQRLLAVERKRARQLALLAETARHLTGHEEPQALMDEAVQRVCKDFGFEYVGILLVEGDSLVVRARQGRLAHAIPLGEQIPLERGIVGQVAQTGQTYLANDVAADEHFVPLPAIPAASQVTLPLRLDKHVIGVLDVQSERAGAFDAADVSTLESLADLIAAGLGSSGLLKELRSRERLAQALQRVGAAVTAALDLPTVLDKICAETLAAFEADGVAVFLVKGETLRAAAACGLGAEAFRGQTIRLDDPHSNSARAARERRPLFVNNLPAPAEGRASLTQSFGVQALLVAPIVKDAQPLGVLAVTDARRPNRFTPADLVTAELLGDQLAVAIQNAHLFDEEQRRAQMLVSLHATLLDLTVQHELPVLLHALVERAAKLLGVPSGGLYLCDPERQEVRCVVSYNTRHDYTGIVLKYGEGAAGHVAQTGQPLIVDDYRHWAGRSDVFEHEQPFISILSAPMIWQGRVTGVLHVEHDDEAHRFTAADQEVLTLFASQAAIAVENARLHTAIKEHVRELRALLTANAALLSTLELEPLLNNVLTAALAAIPAAEKGAILLSDETTQRLQIRATIGYTDPRIQVFAFAGDEGYSAKAVRERRPLLIADARADPAIRYDGDIAEAREILSAIAAPLIPLGSDGRPIGVISLDATRREAFTEADLSLLVAFANTAAAAIDNARLHAQVQELAATDGLTGLANRRTFDEALTAELGRAGRYPYPISLVILDIDSFKQYNDTYGHPAGDERLKAIANLLRTHVREPDLSARYGGEEFALLLPHTKKEGALTLAERIRAAAEADAPPHPGGAPVSGYTLSLGVATYPDDAPTPEALLLAADNAELAAKRAGKNRVVAASYPLASNQ